jgi:hypothetical protein
MTQEQLEIYLANIREMIKYIEPFREDKDIEIAWSRLSAAEQRIIMYLNKTK